MRPAGAVPECTDADNIYLEACRARFEGVKTPTPRGALDSVESMAGEALIEWRGTGVAAESEAGQKQEQDDGETNPSVWESVIRVDLPIAVSSKTRL